MFPFLERLAAAVLIVPAVLYAAIAKGSVSWSVGAWGFNVRSVTSGTQGTTWSGRYLIYRTGGLRRAIGPSLEDRGFQHVGSLDCSIPPTLVDIYRRKRLTI